jgi:hypothetical protein
MPRLTSPCAPGRSRKTRIRCEGTPSWPTRPTSSPWIPRTSPPLDPGLAAEPVDLVAAGLSCLAITDALPQIDEDELHAGSLAARPGEVTKAVTRFTTDWPATEGVFGGDFVWRGTVDVASIRIWLRHPIP